MECNLVMYVFSDEFKSIDFRKVVKKSNFKIYDMRNLYNPSELKKRNLKYYSIGR